MNASTSLPSVSRSIARLSSTHPPAQVGVGGEALERVGDVVDVVRVDQQRVAAFDRDVAAAPAVFEQMIGSPAAAASRTATPNGS